MPIDRSHWTARRRTALAAGAALFVILAGLGGRWALRRRARRSFWKSPPSATLLVGLHSRCRKDADCRPGLSCVEWYGWTGRRETCEIACDPDTPTGSDACPEPLRCVEASDAPSRVCADF